MALSTCFFISCSIFEKEYLLKSDRVDSFIKTRDWYKNLDNGQKKAIDTILNAYIDDDTQPFIPGQNFWNMKHFSDFSDIEIEEALGGVDEMNTYLEKIGEDLYVK